MTRTDPRRQGANTRAETNVGCGVAGGCKDSCEEEERSEGSGEITGPLRRAAAFAERGHNGWV